MTPKDRWLSAIRMQPVDRLPFWPKLDAAYPRAQVGPFCDMELGAIHDWIGSDKHVGIPGCVREVRKRTSVETTSHGKMRRQVYRTPSGETELITQFDEPSQAWHPVQHPIRDLESIKRMTAFFEDVHVELDPDALQQSLPA